VVSRETVRIALTLAALNDLEVKTSDVKNAFLTAPSAGEMYTILGPEFGADQCKTAIIVRALYGLKSAGQSYMRYIADCMRHLGYKPCKADSDLWYKPMVRPEDNFEYYAYLLLWVDACLSIYHNATAALREVDRYFPMKEGSIGDPNIYLRAKLRKVTLSNGVEAWSLSPSKYVQEAVQNTEEHMHKRVLLFNRNAASPWSSTMRQRHMLLQSWIPKEQRISNHLLEFSTGLWNRYDCQSDQACIIPCRTKRRPSGGCCACL